MILMEELSMNAWPSLQTMLYDGWVIRMSNGYSRRGNAVYPLYHGQSECRSTSGDCLGETMPVRSLEEKIAYCESLYRRQGIRPTFKLTAASQPTELDQALERRGYQRAADTLVMMKKMKRERLQGATPDIKTIRVYEAVSGEWISDFCRLAKVREGDRHTLGTMLQAVVPIRYFVSLLQGDQVVACGCTVIEAGFAGVFDVVVDENFRGQGFGEQIMLHLLNIAQHAGAETAYLQVMKENEAAIALYEKIGFEAAYDYWYRILDEH